MIWETVQRWAACRDALLPAIAMMDGTHNENDILSALLAGRMLLWVQGDSGLVTEIVEFPRVRCLNVVLGGGNLKDLMDMSILVTRYARRAGCARVTVLAARPGWERLFASEAKRSGTFLWKEL